MHGSSWAGSSSRRKRGNRPVSFPDETVSSVPDPPGSGKPPIARRFRETFRSDFRTLVAGRRILLAPGDPVDQVSIGRDGLVGRVRTTLRHRGTRFAVCTELVEKPGGFIRCRGGPDSIAARHAARKCRSVLVRPGRTRVKASIFSIEPTAGSGSLPRYRPTERSSPRQVSALVAAFGSKSAINLAISELFSEYTRMIARRIKLDLCTLLEESSVVALLGPRQVGKTTLAMEVGSDQDAHYVDLESSSGPCAHVGSCGLSGRAPRAPRHSG